MKRPVNPVGAKGSKYRGLTLASSRSVERIVNEFGGIEAAMFQGDEVLEVGPDRINLMFHSNGKGKGTNSPFPDTIKASHPVLCLGCVQFYFALSYWAL